MMSKTKTKTARLELTRPIVLVGLMGAGKTTIGRRLASVLKVPFIDADHEIAEAAGCSISDIFAIYGESIFRDLEQRVMLRLLKNEPAVIATGGGAFMTPGIRKSILENATSVWLKAELEVLAERVSRRDTRPLLKTGDRKTILARLIDERYPVYAKADITIDSNADKHETVVKSVLAALSERTDDV